MYCINEVRLLGYIGSTHPSEDGGRISFTLATTRTWRDKNGGEPREETDWHTIVVWSPPDGLTARLAKGARVIVDGRLHTREYDARDGSRRKVVEIVAKPPRVEVLAPPPNRQGAAAGTAWTAPTPEQPAPAPPPPDDDIPY